MVTNNSVMEIQIPVVNHETRPVKSNPVVYNLHRKIKFTITRYFTNMCAPGGKNWEIKTSTKIRKNVLAVLLLDYYLQLNNPIKMDNQISELIK